MGDEKRERLGYHGGTVGALLPFAAFLAGVAWLGISGAPDERGFWPILLGALALGLLLARDRRAWAEHTVQGMSRPIVMIMLLAWMLAGVLATVMNASGFVDALVWLARSGGVSGGGFAVVAFLICCAVSTSTGTSLGTIMLCSPLLYPTGGALGVDPAVLLGAILGGATFGDNISPVSDTTIASAMTQEAPMGGVVRSRMRYAIPAALVAMLGYALLGGGGGRAGDPADVAGSPEALPILIAPAVVIVLLLAGRHLLEGLLTGGVLAIGIGLLLGLISPGELLYIDAEQFGARGLIVDGVNRAVGVSVFTLLLMGLVAGLEAGGLVGDLVDGAGRRVRSVRGAEAWIFGLVSAAVLLTTHAVVAILTVGDFSRKVGERFGIDAYRRANLLDVTVCTWPFLLPWFIPTILAASTTAAGAEAGLPRLPVATVGLWNFHSWALLAVVLLAIATGYGRKRGHSDLAPDMRR
jgi:Na+/H+ antiporter NhaC